MASNNENQPNVENKPAITEHIIKDEQHDEQPLDNNTSTESNRQNMSLPTSRWQPPTEVQNSPSHDDLPSRHYPTSSGRYSYSRKSNPPFERRPVDPDELGISQSIQDALKVRTLYS